MLADLLSHAVGETQNTEEFIREQILALQAYQNQRAAENSARQSPGPAENVVQVVQEIVQICAALENLEANIYKIRSGQIAYRLPVFTTEISRSLLASLSAPALETYVAERNAYSLNLLPALHYTSWRHLLAGFSARRALGYYLKVILENPDSLPFSFGELVLDLARRNPEIAYRENPRGLVLAWVKFSRGKASHSTGHSDPPPKTLAGLVAFFGHSTNPCLALGATRARQRFETPLAIAQVAADTLGLPLGNCSEAPAIFQAGLLFRHAKFIEDTRDFIFVLGLSSRGGLSTEPHKSAPRENINPAAPTMLETWKVAAANRLASRSIKDIVEVFLKIYKLSRENFLWLTQAIPPVDPTELADGAEWLAETIYELPQEIQDFLLGYIGWD